MRSILEGPGWGLHFEHGIQDYSHALLFTDQLWSLLSCSVATVIGVSGVLAWLEGASAIPDACGDLLSVTSLAELCPSACSDGVLIVLVLFLFGRHWHICSQSMHFDVVAWTGYSDVVHTHTIRDKQESWTALKKLQ